MSNLDITQVNETIGKQFAELKENMRQMAREEAKGHVDPLLKENVERSNEAISKSEGLLEKCEKALALAKARKEVDGVLKEVDGLKDAWIAYLRKGEHIEPEQRQMLRVHTKSLNSASDPSGGYLVIPYFDTQIQKMLFETSPLRQYARIVNISTDQYEQPTQLDLAGAYWQDRDHDYVETGTQTWGRQTIRVHKLVSAPRVSNDLLDDAYVDVERELLDSIAMSMDMLENTAHISGTGKGQPRGILTYANGTTWGTIQQVVSGGATTVTYDGLVNLIYSLKDGYLANARFLMARGTVAAFRLIKDTQGNPLWSPGFGTEPATILGYPIARAADLPAIAAGSLSVVFGDFRRAYTIVDRAGTSILRDPYTNAPFVNFVTTRRTGGDVTNFEAVKILRTAAS